MLSQRISPQIPYLAPRVPPSDTYQTITAPTEGLFKDRGSKFYAYAHPVTSEEEIKELLVARREEHHTSRHVCYAYKLGPKGDRYRANDDGEPSGTAGKPIYGQLESNNLTNVLVMVVRYFGGTKLGVGGLINAYRTAAAEALSQATVETRTVDDVYELRFAYPLMNPVMRIIKERSLKIVEQDFQITCRLVFRVRQSESESVANIFGKMNNLDVELITTA